MAFLNIFSSKKEPKNTKSKKVIIDHREKNSLVPSVLQSKGIETEFKQLPVADYIIGETAIERKTISDFKSSIVNKRIISQLLELKQYPNPILLLEGLAHEDPYSGIGIHENAFRGFLLSVINDYKVPIIFTMDEKDTANYIDILARKQEKNHNPLRASKIKLSEEEQVRFVLEGFPQIGPSAINKLIEKFKTLSEIINASEEELRDCIGKKAESIINLRDFKLK